MPQGSSVSNALRPYSSAEDRSSRYRSKKLHGEIRKECLRAQLDRSLAPVLGAIEITEIQEKPAGRSDVIGISGIDRHTLPKPSNRLVELPSGGPIMEPYPIITDRKIGIDLDRLAQPHQGLVNPAQRGVTNTDECEDDWRPGIQLSRLLD